MIEHIGKNKLKAVFLSLVTEKAFDQVNWEFLYRVLQNFGFHQTFINNIQVLYNKPNARIKINGALSNPFDLERGTGQGCLVRPLLFALLTDSFSQGITQNNNIKGIKMLEQENKVSLFADDILTYLSCQDSTILELLSFLDVFSSVSGYQVNIPKTQVLSFNYKPSQIMRSKIQQD